MKNTESNSKVTVNKYFLSDVQELIDKLNLCNLSQDIAVLVDKVQAELYDKYEAMKRRKLYSAAKNTDNAEFKAIVRDMYFDSRGIHNDFRDPNAFGSD
jgi:hypothetical protein